MAQKSASYKYFCDDNSLKAHGYFFGAGLSMTQGRTEIAEQFIDVSSTTRYLATFDAKGSIGLQAEVGGFYINKVGPFRIIEMGLGYRQVRGRESTKADRLLGADRSYPELVDAQGKFLSQRIHLRVNPQFVTILGQNNYLHFGPGFFLDNALTQKTIYDQGVLGSSGRSIGFSQSAFINLTAGLAFTLSSGKHIDVYMHSPMLGLGKESALRSEVFSSSYREYIIGIRYFWQSKRADRTCPAFGYNKVKPGSKKRRSPDSKRPW